MEETQVTPQGTAPAAEPVAAPTLAPAPAAIVSPEPQAGDGSEHISLDEARKLRSEAQSLRKRMKAFEDAELAARDAQLSELERTKKQHADLQAKYDAAVTKQQTTAARYAIKDAAHTLNFLIPDVAHRLLDSADFVYDEDGTLTNAHDLLKKLLKSYPELERKAPEPVAPPSSAATPASPTPAAAPVATAPVLPAMNPGSAGRSSFTAPQQVPAGQRFTPVTLNDVFKRA